MASNRFFVPTSNGTYLEDGEFSKTLNVDGTIVRAVNSQGINWGICRKGRWCPLNKEQLPDSLKAYMLLINEPL